MADRVDPYKGHLFLVEIDGITQASFAECSGFASQVEVIEYREGGDPNQVRKLVGKTSFQDITLKRGLTSSSELYDWHQTAMTPPLQRKNGSVVILDETFVEQVRWNFTAAWISKWEGPALDGKGTDVAVETVTISCETLKKG
jgi:phage tail-like protein